MIIAVDFDGKLGFASSNIVGCCKGKRKQAYGFKWKYKT